MFLLINLAVQNITWLCREVNGEAFQENLCQITDEVTLRHIADCLFVLQAGPNGLIVPLVAKYGDSSGLSYSVPP